MATVSAVDISDIVGVWHLLLKQPLHDATKASKEDESHRASCWIFKNINYA